MQTAFSVFIEEISKPEALRKGFIRKRRNPFSISDDRINELYDIYFSDFISELSKFSFEVDPNDLEELVYLLRVYFRIWIEMEGNQITIYREFPKRFRLLEAISTENHPYTPIAIPKGTIMELASNAYGVANYSNGIPLTAKILTEAEGVSTTLKPSLQINYPFIEAIHTSS